MATDEKSFADLVKEAPATPATGTISLIGTLAQSSEAGKFVLTLQDGRSVTLEIAVVKGHAVLGASVGQTIVRVDVDAGKIPTISPDNNSQPLPWVRFADASVGWMPFSLLAPHQASAQAIAAIEAATPVGSIRTGLYFDFPKPPQADGTYPTPHGWHRDV
jgi:hypothetical protein